MSFLTLAVLGGSGWGKAAWLTLITVNIKRLAPGCVALAQTLPDQ